MVLSFPLRTSWFSLLSEPHGPLYLLHQSCMTLSFLPPNLVVLSFPSSEPRGPLLFYFRTTWPSSFPLRTSWFSYSLQNRVAPYLLQSHMVSSSMAAAPRFKSQRPSSFAAPFPTPPTVSYTCQHPRILPALLGCHCKSGKVWPHGVEPIISKLSHRPCNQGELLPSPTLGGSHSHPPGSQHGHSYLTYL